MFKKTRGAFTHWVKSMTSTKSQQTSKGFSLIELLIVLSLILIMATLAVPNYMAARSRANEASATASVRAIITAQNMYRNTFGAFTDLNQLGGDYLTDNMLAAGQKSGYMFISNPDSGSGTLLFTVEATPVLSLGASRTGQRHYFGDQSAVIRFDLSGPANTSSSPLQ